MQLEIYDKNNIDALNMPSTPLSGLAKSFLIPMVKLGTKHFIENSDCDVSIIKLNDKIIPIVINHGKPQICSLTSPSSHFFLYGADEFKHHPSFSYRLLFKFIKGLYHCTRFLKMDKTVQINNWLIPTNPSLGLTPEDMQALTEKLESLYPDHAIVFKSVNTQQLDGFKKLAGNAVKSRVVYYWDGKNVVSKHKRYLKNDLKLLSENDYTLTELFTPSDIPRMLSLYQGVYLDKHSALNPAYTPEAFSNFINNTDTGLCALSANNHIDAFYTYLKLPDEMIFSIIGHDKQINQDKGLYRRLFRHVLKQSEENHLPVNLSGGVGQFKRNRGATAEPEFDIYCVKHLSWYQRSPWQLIAKATNHSMMEKIAADA